MPVLIMMNKPYNDREALETVVHYVLRAGSGYCGGYGVVSIIQSSRCSRLRICGGRTMAAGSAILFYLSKGPNQSDMTRP